MGKKILICLICVLSIIGFCVNDSRITLGAGRIIYTAATKGNSDTSGNGTKINPYNLFETALANANDGDTIYILSAGGFLNASDNSPLVINKNITIKGENSVFNVRASGIVLGADVTFENVVFSFGSRYHDAIFANGHNLTLKNVSCQSGTRKVDIFGGGLYINGANCVSSGASSVITIDGGGSNFGNIYAGSLNGDFAGGVTLNLSNMSNSRNTNIYISGANEPYVNLDDLFNLEEPAAPTVNANHTISGAVNINIADCNFSNVSQAAVSSAGSSTLTVNTNGKYWSSISVENINTVKVTGGGVLAPTKLSGIGNLTLANGGVDLSNLSNPSLKKITSEGSNNKLILGKEQYLTISDSATGSFVFETVNGYNNHSGPALYDFAYIRMTNSSSAVFSFSCIPGMEMTLDKVSSYKAMDTGVTYGTVWKTSVASEYSPFAITGLEITNPSITVTVSEFSNSVSYNANVSVSDELANQDCWFDLVPIQYKVKYMGVEYNGVAEYDGYSYYADIPALKLSFMAMSDYDLSGAKICVYTYVDGSNNAIKQPECGIYTITIMPFSEGEQITKTVKLIITDENGNYPKEPETETPSKEPAKEPETEGATKEPVTEGQTKEPATEGQTKEPVTEGQTKEPVTEGPTKEPVTEGSTKEPVTEGPTKETVTESLTEESVTQGSTKETVTERPTKEESVEETSKRPNEQTQTEELVVDVTTYQSEVESYTNQISGEDNKLPKPMIGIIIAGGILIVGFGVVFGIKFFKTGK